MTKELVVLAAGMGSRYGGLKQIDPVGPGGELVIDYSVFDALRAGFSRVVFVIREEMLEPFRDGIGRALEPRLDVTYAFQRLDDLPPPFAPPPGREKPWGTGHALWAARREVRQPFAVINADDFYGPQAFRLLAAHLDLPPAEPPEYAMIAYELAQTVSSHGSVSRGLCRTDAQGNLIDIEEVTAIRKTAEGLCSITPDGATRQHENRTPTSMNCWGFYPGIFGRLEDRFCDFLSARAGDATSEFYLPGAVSDLIAAGQARVKVLTTPDAWLGVTYREDKPLVMAGIQGMIQRGTYPASLWA
ncbi:MAG TPA: NTP transferase domain-containing protein [Kiritimatiellia bacterium]|nr:NTP transferase domain-containing protein [Kiritimatiellia bacterium]HMO97586.1 NTP transferase domain-containing protein [Kiritimatiellia bacterium]HMP96783.1 NTP transferase domain-containing protein [Kiritimatiellia bacterium]